MAKFVPASSNGGYSDPFSEVTWNNNPIYQSPESAGVSWFDQVEHWNAPDEGIEAVSSNVANLSEPLWASRSTFEGYSWNQGIEGLWRNIENQTTKNAQSATQEIAPAFADTTNVSEMSSELSGTAEATEELVEGPEAAIEATETGIEVAESSTGIGIAAILNQQLGSATTSALSAQQSAQINSDFIQNSTRAGIGALQQAEIIKGEEEVNQSKTTALSQVGSIIGPLGSLIGQAVGQAVYQPSNPGSLNTAFGFDGRIDPQDTGVVQSLNTDAATGDTQQVENV